MSYLLYHKHSQKIIYETPTGSVTILRKDKKEYLKDTIENISLKFILGILAFSNSKYLVIVKNCECMGKYKSNDIFKITQVDFLPLSDSRNDDMISYLKDLIHTNDFYAIKEPFTDEEFIWNRYMKENFYKIKDSTECNLKLQHYPEHRNQNFMIGHLICGFFISKYVNFGSDNIEMKLLSLVSSNKMGTRLLSRGIDDEGNVSFYVETDFIVNRNDENIFNFKIIRGSVPLFWRQKNKGINGKLYFTGSGKRLENAFDMHFKKLNDKFPKIHVLTLLNQKKDEKLLNDAYIDMLRNKHIPHTAFDLNSYTADFDDLQGLLYWKLDKVDTDDTVYRVNCIDCLDRTNLAQSLICTYRFERIMKDSFLKSLMQACWTKNGSSLSNLYTGSDVMKKELASEQKRTLKGYLDDFMISATRLINNRFLDKQKNKSINILLSKYEISDEEEDLSDESEK